MLYNCYRHVIQCYKRVVHVLYSVHLLLRIDSSGIAANTHRHLLACEADRKTKKEQEHPQEHEQEQTSSASQSLVVIIGIAASHHQRHCR